MKNTETYGSAVTDGVIDSGGNVDPAVAMWAEAYASLGSAA